MFNLREKIIDIKDDFVVVFYNYPSVLLILGCIIVAQLIF